MSKKDKQNPELRSGKDIVDYAAQHGAEVREHKKNFLVSVRNSRGKFYVPDTDEKLDVDSLHRAKMWLKRLGLLLVISFVLYFLL